MNLILKYKIIRFLLYIYYISIILHLILPLVNENLQILIEIIKSVNLLFL